MKSYIPLAALGFALGEARAEEQKECIDSLNLTVEIKPSVKTEGIEATIDSALQVVQKFYWREVSLPVQWKYQTQREQSDIHITFGSVDDCMQEWFSTGYAVDEYQMTVRPDRRQLFEYEMDRLSKDEIYRSVQEPGLLLRMKSTLQRALGITHSAKNAVYIFPDSSDPLDYSKILSISIVHELAHILTGNNDDSNRKPTDVMCAGGWLCHLEGDEERTIDQLNLSPEDRAKIRAQMCKPEETK